MRQNPDVEHFWRERTDQTAAQYVDMRASPRDHQKKERKENRKSLQLDGMFVFGRKNKIMPVARTIIQEVPYLPINPFSPFTPNYNPITS